MDVLVGDSISFYGLNYLDHFKTEILLWDLQDKLLVQNKLGLSLAQLRPSLFYYIVQIIQIHIDPLLSSLFLVISFFF